jgi:ATP-dependent exoDNAse (exonuclease V) alpha subunit
MIQELDRVVLTTNIPEYSLEQGDIGTVVLVHRDRQGYEVEFITLNGETIAVVSLSSEQVRSIGSKEIAHVRVLN